MTNIYKIEHAAYHHTDFKYLHKTHKSIIMKELVDRTNFSNKYFKGSLDNKHKKIMEYLGAHLSTSDKVNLPLQVCINIRPKYHSK